MIRNMYHLNGVNEYYSTVGKDYINPHINVVRDHLSLYDFNGKNVLDMGCGLGEVTDAIRDDAHSVMGCDPYLHREYTEITGKECQSLSFKDIAVNGLPQSFDMIICSFSLHLCEPSILPTFLFQISMACENLLVITPNKKPTINCAFSLIAQHERARVKSRMYKSITIVE